MSASSLSTKIYQYVCEFPVAQYTLPKNHTCLSPLLHKHAIIAFILLSLTHLISKTSRTLYSSASIPYSLTWSYHNLCDRCIPHHPAHATRRLMRLNANLPRLYALEQKKKSSDGSASELPSVRGGNESEQRGYGKNASERS